MGTNDQKLIGSVISLVHKHEFEGVSNKWMTVNIIVAFHFNSHVDTLFIDVLNKQKIYV